MREKPDYLIAHLIVSLPLVLFFFFKFNTRLIIRISGTPKLNFWRRIVWSLLSNNIYLVTCPTQSTLDKLVNQRVFPKNKLKLLYDPILNIKSINVKKFERLDDKLKGIEFILGIGRLTKQKNFSLLIRSFKEILIKYPDLKLIILGDGEERYKLNQLVKQLSLEEKIYLEGYKKNIFNYVHNCECYISSSLYEDPGFTLIEAGFLNKTVIAADSKTGTTEIINNSKNGFLFENNNKRSLIDKYFLFKKMSINEIKEKKINLKTFSKNFTFFNHYKNLNKILSD
jgi:glycosyltransferase involved in cell wall biosynthesis